jgi:hypothetical protein
MLGAVAERERAGVKPPEPAPREKSAPGPVTAVEHVLALQRTVGNHRTTRLLQRQPAKTGDRQDVVVIVGRASHTIEKQDTAEGKELHAAWRAAAANLAPRGRVFEGLTVDDAFKGINKLGTPIGKLFIIGHGDPAGVEEIDAKTGGTISATMEDITKRMRTTLGDLKGNAPQSVEILYCSAGGSPQALAKIGEATGAKTVRAPVQPTVIGALTFSVGGKKLTVADMKKHSDDDLRGFIRQTDALKQYDFVPGVPHPDKDPSDAEKMTALIGVLRSTGSIPRVSFNEAPGKRKAVAMQNASVDQRASTSEDLTDAEFLGGTGVIEVEVKPAAATTKKPVPAGAH